jgi:hypothetical protein
MWNKMNDKNEGNKREIEDWMNGDGGKVMALILIALGVWFVVSLFWH